MPVAARLLSRSIEKSFLTVRPSPYARPRSGSGRIQPPAGAGEKPPKGTHFFRASNRIRSESSRSMSGRSPFATSGLFLRSLRRNTVPHGPVYRTLPNESFAHGSAKLSYATVSTDARPTAKVPYRSFPAFMLLAVQETLDLVRGRFLEALLVLDDHRNARETVYLGIDIVQQLLLVSSIRAPSFSLTV